MIRAWNPLQIPKTSPFLFSKRFITSSAILSSLRMLAMNFPEPSGSSPAENPPDRASIWAFSRSEENSFKDSEISACDRLRIITVFVSAPAIRKALAISYSQFVPGNTGRTTRGLGVFTTGPTPGFKPLV